MYRIQLNYSELSDNLKDLDDHDEVQKYDRKLTKTIAEMTSRLQTIQAPNLRVRETFPSPLLVTSSEIIVIH